MTPLELLRKNIIDELAAPVFVKVKKAFIKKESGGYCFDGVVLMPETLEETDEILKEVPLPPIWGGDNGQGIFCPPSAGQIAIVGFVGFNKSFPFYQGIWSDSYTPSSGADGTFVLTDGKGLELKLLGDGKLEIGDGKGGFIKFSGDGLLSFLNNSKSLKAILEELADGFINLKTIGAPPSHTSSPDVISLFTKLKTEIGLLFKE